jgi:hypothetical protein
MKVVTRCPYCQEVVVLQGTERGFITCSCRSTWAAYSALDAAHVGVSAPGHSYECVPGALPIEEAAARQNVADLINRIAALEQRINQHQQAGNDLAARVTELEEQPAPADTSLAPRVTEIEYQLKVLDADSSGAALARKLGAYLWKVRA